MLGSGLKGSAGVIDRLRFEGSGKNVEEVLWEMGDQSERNGNFQMWNNT